VKHQHQIGDIVRLSTGWTPMVVIGFDIYENVLAKYWGLAHHWEIFQDCYDNPEAHKDQRRPQSQFKPWDKAPINKQVYKPMNNYKTKFGDIPFTGTQRGVTSSGQVILESTNGVIGVFDSSRLELNIPFTFSVRAINHNNHYSCHYTLSAGVSVNVGDVLMSKKGNIYTVVNLDTKNKNPKKEFEGQRLVTRPL